MTSLGIFTRIEGSAGLPAAAFTSNGHLGKKAVQVNCGVRSLTDYAESIREGGYSAAFCASVSTTAIFCTNSWGKPCLSFKYSGLL